LVRYNSNAHKDAEVLKTTAW